MIKGFNALIGEHNKELGAALGIKSNYKDVSGITHIYVKDEDEIQEIVLEPYVCSACGNRNSYWKYLCGPCDSKGDMHE